jgi:hypothetical protein
MCMRTLFFIRLILWMSTSVLLFYLSLASYTFLWVTHHTWPLPNNPYSFAFFFSHSLRKVKAFMKRIKVNSINIFPSFFLSTRRFHTHIYFVQLSTKCKLFITICVLIFFFHTRKWKLKFVITPLWLHTFFFFPVFFWHIHSQWERTREKKKKCRSELCLKKTNGFLWMSCERAHY